MSLLYLLGSRRKRFRRIPAAVHLCTILHRLARVNPGPVSSGNRCAQDTGALRAGKAVSHVGCAAVMWTAAHHHSFGGRPSFQVRTEQKIKGPHFATQPDWREHPEPAME